MYIEVLQSRLEKDMKNKKEDTRDTIINNEVDINPQEEILEEISSTSLTVKATCEQPCLLDG